MGSLGAIFSQITGNHIYNIWAKRLFGGAEMAGIKIHAAIDVLIKNNRINNAGRGLWLDWMAQGTRITGNLCYNNSSDDILLEVDHGPFLVDNNLFLSDFSLRDVSEGGAFAHNLMAGEIDTAPELNRSTPYHYAHSTALAGSSNISGGDDRFYNNIFARTVASTHSFLPDSKEPPRFAGYGLWVYDTREYPIQTGGNVYYNGARPYAGETDPLVLSDVDPGLTLVEEGDSVILHFTLGQALRKYSTTLVTTNRLGKNRIAGLAYENPDGSPLKIDEDYFGKHRDVSDPRAGPFADPGPDRRAIRVW